MYKYTFSRTKAAKACYFSVLVDGKGSFLFQCAKT